MSCSSSSTMVWLTRETSEGPSQEITDRAGKILVSSGSDMWPSEDITTRAA